jgi:hypothetical protein
MNRSTRWVAAIAVLCLCIATPVLMSAANNNGLDAALKAKYELTKTGWDRVRITKPGTVLVLMKDGISADLSSDLTYLDNEVENGEISQRGGFMAEVQNKKTSRMLKAGEKVFVYDIKVKGDVVHYFLITAETFDVNKGGSTRQTRYKAVVSFHFPSGFLSTADADAVKKVVDKVVVPESEVPQAAPKTVQLGQTPDQVKAALGEPNKIVKLGPKEIFVYKDMKVIFMDGKVSDVE